MKSKSFVTSFFIVLLMVVVGCDKKGVQPVAIDDKKDKCDICNMSVTDNQFATEVILENGKAIKFAEIGCMYKWMEQHQEDKLQAKFVRDYNSKDWVELEKATFVYDKDISTPMAYNMISFQNKKDAETFVSKSKGKLLTSQDLENHRWEINKNMMIKMHEELGEGMNHSH
ncbi:MULTISPECIES: nitrous oxide reductase accessory protein NosL [Bacillus]|uniref:Lipoprotein n=1 Tax=Bacillus cereus TaxID=1396 RepID=A0AAN5XIC1_BACCE|nr:MULTISPECIES: nitrous oxide reductase accessory protein NosL [Bacillus]AXR17078.1 hypothetical protein DOS87_13620 [Bacillus sp. CR71]AXR22772.1 hypothetical protein DPQ26_13385 [Bacillus sp. E25]KAB2446029.1 hypothetical protein F8165_28250 [Bacillus cereus]KAB2486773.1 hypothetical protein F8157_09460 [Bacillus cereus]OJE33637.1 hypothetical protein A9490_20470 [Bacillus thuringiensis]